MFVYVGCLIDWQNDECRLQFAVLLYCLVINNLAENMWIEVAVLNYEIFYVSASPPYIPPPYSFDNQHKDKAASAGNEIPW